MIEVEKNFDISPSDKERLIKESQFLGKKVFTDIYYDTTDYGLTRKDRWLRQRNNKWELKIPFAQKDANERITDQYYELENEKEIAKALEINFTESFSEAVKRSGFFPLATITTTRETYQKEDFRIDFDEMDFGFSALEVELLVVSESEVPLAEKRILEFAKNHGLKDNKVRAKVIEYLFRNNLDHYNMLVATGIIKE